MIPQKTISMLTPRLLEGMLCGSALVKDKDLAELRQTVVVTFGEGVTGADKEKMRTEIVGVGWARTRKRCGRRS